MIGRWLNGKYPKYCRKFLNGPGCILHQKKKKNGKVLTKFSRSEFTAVKQGQKIYTLITKNGATKNSYTSNSCNLTKH